MPLQIGAPDVAFPRLNTLAFWFFVFGGVIVCIGFLTPGGSASFGWFAYSPLSERDQLAQRRLRPLDPRLHPRWSRHDPRRGQLHHHDLLHARARHDDVPDADLHVERAAHQHPRADGVPGAGRGAASSSRPTASSARWCSTPANGGAILWQHLFWFFGHPEVYILALPFFGIASEILPVFSRKPIFGYKGLVFATIAIAALSVAVWAHHMYVTGAVNLPFFSFMTMLIAVPTGVKFFNWIGTMWRGQVSFETPMLWTLGFLVTFLFGGLTGILLSAPPVDFQVSDSYFVVAHFHYVVFGTVVFVMFAGFYFWWPKWTGRDARRASRQDPLLAAVRRLPGDVPRPALARRRGHAPPVRRLPASRTASPTLNVISTVGAFILATSTLPFFWNVYKTCKTAPLVDVDDPWGWGCSLEWATSCPPPRHNFTTIPPIRSERPAFDLHHPELVDLATQKRHAVLDGLVEAGATKGIDS